MKTEIGDIVSKAVEAAYPGVVVKHEISYPDPQYGDVATNIGFKLAKELRLPPPEISAKIAAAISHPDIEQADAAGGYVNLRMSQSFWVGQLRNITENYGTSKIGEGKKAQVEFISANPTGPLHLGNGRGGYVGDVIARVLARNGYGVTREYYVNDAGGQIGLLVESVKASAGLAPPRDGLYAGDYIKELAAKMGEMLKSAEVAELGNQLTAAVIADYIQPTAAKMGITFDEWFSERSLVMSGAQQDTFNLLEKRDMEEKKDGAVWLKSTGYGDERDRVLRKSDGVATYLAGDLAYHCNIFDKRGFDLAVKVWGADHAGQWPSLKLTMQQLYPEKQLDFVILQWVRLIQGGKEVKMSKRAGTYVTVDELIDEVGPDVARFFFLMRSVDTAMDFDLDLAKEQSQKNPLFYVMYSYARAHSIMAQAATRKLAPIDTLTELDEYEVALVRHLSRFPQLVADIAADYGVHKLTYFGIETAKLFHELYESTRIIDLDHATASRRLYLIDRYIMFMKSYFSLLGITPVSRMDREVEQPAVG